MNNFDNHFKEFIWDRITSRWEAEGINPEHEAAEKRAGGGGYKKKGRSLFQSTIHKGTGNNRPGGLR